MKVNPTQDVAVGTFSESSTRWLQPLTKQSWTRWSSATILGVNIHRFQNIQRLQIKKSWIVSLKPTKKKSFTSKITTQRFSGFPCRCQICHLTSFFGAFCFTHAAAWTGFFCRESYGWWPPEIRWSLTSWGKGSLSHYLRRILAPSQVVGLGISGCHQPYFLGIKFLESLKKKLNAFIERDFLGNREISGQIIIFHQPRLTWNKGGSMDFPYLSPPFGVKTRVRSL